MIELLLEKLLQTELSFSTPEELYVVVSKLIPGITLNDIHNYYNQRFQEEQEFENEPLHNLIEKGEFCYGFAD